MLNVGDRAPAFEAHTDSGDTVSLDGLLAEGPFVLYFYPADFTPVCTKEACMFRDAHPRLVQAGVRVYGVSPQGTSSHAAFREKHDLNFPLLADPDHAVCEAFGVWGEQEWQGHRFTGKALLAKGPFTHVRVRMLPDGGGFRRTIRPRYASVASSSHDVGASSGGIRSRL